MKDDDSKSSAYKDSFPHGVHGIGKGIPASGEMSHCKK